MYDFASISVFLISRLYLNLRGEEQPKIGVSMKELRRRCSPPESFSAKAIRKYLRIGDKAKCPVEEFAARMKKTSRFSLLTERKLLPIHDI